MDDLFITGTDTGVGKTVIAGAIASYYRGMGKAVGVFKPVETGCKSRGGKHVPSDATFLKRAAGTTDILGAVCPYTFEPPLAPAMAAMAAGKCIDTRLIVKVYRAISRVHDITLVEGAGGIMVPICGTYTYLDLAAELGLPVVVVGRAGLGTINHTVLTINALASRGLVVHSVILKNSGRRKPDESAKDNPAAIEEQTGIKRIYSMPYIPGVKRSAGALAKAAARLKKQGFFGLT